MADEAVARVTRRYLQEAGDVICCDVYPRGRTLLLELHARQYDCLLLDELLLDMDSLEFMEQLSRRGIPVGLPIIFLLRSSHRAIHEQLLSYGANYCMIKPYDLTTLLHRIRLLCRQSAGRIAAECSRLYQSWQLPGDHPGCGYLTEAVILAELHEERLAIKKELLAEVSGLHVALSANAVECSLRRLVDRLEEDGVSSYLAFKRRAGFDGRPTVGRLVYAVCGEVHRAVCERGEEKCTNQPDPTAEAATKIPSCVN